MSVPTGSWLPNHIGFSNLSEETRKELERLNDWLDRINCGTHEFAFHDDNFRFHTCVCNYLEVFYVVG